MYKSNAARSPSKPVGKPVDIRHTKSVHSRSRRHATPIHKPSRHLAHHTKLPNLRSLSSLQTSSAHSLHHIHNKHLNVNHSTQLSSSNPSQPVFPVKPLSISRFEPSKLHSSQDHVHIAPSATPSRLNIQSRTKKKIHHGAPGSSPNFGEHLTGSPSLHKRKARPFSSSASFHSSPSSQFPTSSFGFHSPQHDVDLDRRRDAARGDPPKQELRFTMALRRTMIHVWERGDPKSKLQVLTAAVCLVIGKIFNVTMPLLYRDAIDDIGKQSPLTAEYTIHTHHDQHEIDVAKPVKHHQPAPAPAPPAPEQPVPTPPVTDDQTNVTTQTTTTTTPPVPETAVFSDPLHPIHDFFSTENISARIRHMLSDLTFVNEDNPASLVVALLVSYGLLRMGSVAFSEMKNFLFSQVVATSVEKFSAELITRLLTLDRTFHVARDTPSLCKAIDRGIHALRILLSTVAFESLPSVVEITLTLGLLASALGPIPALIGAVTILAYTRYTHEIVVWRGKFRRQFNKADNIVTRLEDDFLINWQSAQGLNNIMFLQRIYNKAMNRFTHKYMWMIKSNVVLSLGQVSLFSAGMTCAMIFAFHQVSQHELTLGEFVALHGFFLNLLTHVRTLGSSYANLKSAVLDMQASLSLDNHHSTLYSSPNPVHLRVAMPTSITPLPYEHIYNPSYYLGAGITPATASSPALLAATTAATNSAALASGIFRIQARSAYYSIDLSSLPACFRPLPTSFDSVDGRAVIEFDLDKPQTTSWFEALRFPFMSSLTLKSHNPLALPSSATTSSDALIGSNTSIYHHQQSQLQAASQQPSPSVSDPTSAAIHPQRVSLSSFLQVMASGRPPRQQDSVSTSTYQPELYQRPNKMRLATAEVVDSARRDAPQGERDITNVPIDSVGERTQNDRLTDLRDSLYGKASLVTDSSPSSFNPLALFSTRHEHLRQQATAAAASVSTPTIPKSPIVSKQITTPDSTQEPTAKDSTSGDSKEPPLSIPTLTKMVFPNLVTDSPPPIGTDSTSASSPAYSSTQYLLNNDGLPLLNVHNHQRTEAFDGRVFHDNHYLTLPFHFTSAQEANRYTMSRPEWSEQKLQVSFLVDDQVPYFPELILPDDAFQQHHQQYMSPYDKQQQLQQQQQQQQQQKSSPHRQAHSHLSPYNQSKQQQQQQPHQHDAAAYHQASDNANNNNAASSPVDSLPRTSWSSHNRRHHVGPASSFAESSWSGLISSLHNHQAPFAASPSHHSPSPHQLPHYGLSLSSTSHHHHFHPHRSWFSQPTPSGAYSRISSSPKQLGVLPNAIFTLRNPNALTAQHPQLSADGSTAGNGSSAAPVCSLDHPVAPSHRSAVRSRLFHEQFTSSRPTGTTSHQHRLHEGSSSDSPFIVSSPAATSTHVPSDRRTSPHTVLPSTSTTMQRLAESVASSNVASAGDAASFGHRRILGHGDPMDTDGDVPQQVSSHLHAPPRGFASYYHDNGTPGAAWTQHVARRRRLLAERRQICAEQENQEQQQPQQQLHHTQEPEHLPSSGPLSVPITSSPSTTTLSSVDHHNAMTEPHDSFRASASHDEVSLPVPSSSAPSSPILKASQQEVERHVEAEVAKLSPITPVYDGSGKSIQHENPYIGSSSPAAQSNSDKEFGLTEQALEAIASTTEKLNATQQQLSKFSDSLFNNNNNNNNHITSLDQSDAYQEYQYQDNDTQVVNVSSYNATAAAKPAVSENIAVPGNASILIDDSHHATTHDDHSINKSIDQTQQPAVSSSDSSSLQQQTTASTATTTSSTTPEPTKTSSSLSDKDVSIAFAPHVFSAVANYDRIRGQQCSVGMATAMSASAAGVASLPSSIPSSNVFSSSDPVVNHVISSYSTFDPINPQHGHSSQHLHNHHHHHHHHHHHQSLNHDHIANDAHQFELTSRPAPLHIGFNLHSAHLSHQVPSAVFHHLNPGSFFTEETTTTTNLNESLLSQISNGGDYSHSLNNDDAFVNNNNHSPMTFFSSSKHLKSDDSDEKRVRKPWNSHVLLSQEQVHSKTPSLVHPPEFSQRQTNTTNGLPPTQSLLSLSAGHHFVQHDVSTQSNLDTGDIYAAAAAASTSASSTTTPAGVVSTDHTTVAAHADVSTPHTHQHANGQPDTASQSLNSTHSQHHASSVYSQQQLAATKRDYAKQTQNFQKLQRLKESMCQLLGRAQPSVIPSFPRYLDISEGTEYELHNVTLFNSQTQALMLNNVSMRIPKKSKVVIVGAHRSGKSQILNLLNRSIDPNIGTVLMNNVSLKDIRPTDINGITGKIDSDTALFNMSAFDNVLLANRFATDLEVIRAMQRARLSTSLIPSVASLAKFHREPGDLMLLPETVGEKGGILISAANRQRISLARMILKNPMTLLCDDLTTMLSLDSGGMHRSILELATNKTLVSVTHQLKYAKDADIIFVMKEGELTEQGQHSTLLAKNGEYARLWRIQGYLYDMSNDLAA